MVSLTMGNSSFPFAHGRVGDEQTLGELLLGQAQFLAPLTDEGAEIFSGFHGHTLLCLDVPCKTIDSVVQRGKKVKNIGRNSLSTVGKVQ